MAGGEVKAKVGTTKELEFGGIPGTAGMVLGLPVGVYAINLACNKESCNLYPLPQLPALGDFWDTKVALIFLGWFIFQVILQLLPTGKVAEGLPLRTGEKLKYRCNAFIALLFSLAAFAVLYMSGHDVTYVYDKFIPLATAATTFSFLLSLYLYYRSYTVPNHDLAAGGNSGVMVYDFFMGRELNPRFGSLDLKFFCELRPGLIGWVMLDLIFMVRAHEMYGSVPPSLLIVSGFHILYVADALWNEEAILTTMDIVHDGFGLMLAFGDLVWVPFLYSLQARFLLEHSQHWSTLGLAAIVALNMIGYLIFRGSNSQKNAFRTDPHQVSVAHLETLKTASGRQLLISGWWGFVRHPNYLGDLIMALAWSLPCGFQSLLPYFYPLYFLGLLIHRNSRDEHNCRQKYGKDWDKYCSIVKYAIFPYIY